MENVEKVTDVKAKVFEIVDAMAAKIGTTIDYAWPKIVEYEWACALSFVVGSLLAVLVSGIIFFCLYRYFNKLPNDSYENRENKGIAGAFSIMSFSYYATRI